MRLVIILLFATALQTCCATKTMAVEKTNLHIPIDINGTYLVKSLNDQDIMDAQLTISFNGKEQKISGFSGCNRFFGNYTLNEKNIKIGPLASTKKMCPETDNNLEFEMLTALSKINNVQLNNGILELLTDDTVMITAAKENTSPIFTYTAQSRGTFLELIVNQSTVSVTKDKSSQLISKSSNEEAWNKLLAILNEVRLDSLSAFKAPTEARFYDGAAIAKLKIDIGDKTYESQPFDHGEPPIEIAALVKEILSISQIIE